MQIFKSGLIHKAGILVLALVIVVVGTSIMSKNFRSKLSKLPGEVAGIIIENGSGKFLDSVSLVGATGTAPYQNISGDVLISGNVGIGTTTPNEKLDVAGNSQLLGPGRKIYGNTDPANYYIGNYPVAGSDGLDLHWFGGIRLGTATGTVLQATSDGNVGIGTIIPNSKLTVDVGATPNQGIRLQDSAGRNVGFRANTGNGSYNPLTQAGDLALIYSGTAADTGALVIGQWSNSARGIRIDSNGNIGIGTANPGTTLAVTDTLGTSTLNGAGITGNRSAWYLVNNYVGGNIYMQIGGVNKYHFNSAGTAYASGWSTPYSDYAEYYDSQQPLENGDLVSIDINHNKFVKKSSDSSAQSILGIKSTKPGFVGGVKNIDGDYSGYAIAIAGRIPTKIMVTKNTIIQSGDSITSSILEGFGTKANGAGTIVGKALESTADWNNQKCPTITSINTINWPTDDGTNTSKPCFKLPNGIYVGKIMVSVGASWYDPDAYLTSTDNFHFDFGELRAHTDNLVTRIGAFGKLIAGKIQASIIETQKLIVNGVDILEKVNAQQQEIDQLKEEIKLLKAK